MISESMISKFFENAAAKLAENGSIQEKYIALYAKAMEVVLAITVNTVTALLIGYFLGMWWHCIILLAAFIPLRSYAGGYHARGYISCYLESCVLLASALLFIKYFIYEGTLIVRIWQLFLVSVIIIFLFAPLADENKPISEKEAKVFKRRARIIAMIEAAAVMGLTYFQSTYSYAVMMAVIISALVLVLHQGRKYLLSRQERDDV